MSGGTWRHDSRPLKGLYRDRENGWIFGVCAGIADYSNLGIATIRIIVAVCLLLFFWATLLLYLAAILLFKAKPLTYSGRSEEYEFWRRHTRHDGWRHS